MTGTEKLKKHEVRNGYLKMAIALNLSHEDREDCDEALHSREVTLLLSAMARCEVDFINELLEH